MLNEKYVQWELRIYDLFPEILFVTSEYREAYSEGQIEQGGYSKTFSGNVNISNVKMHTCKSI